MTNTQPPFRTPWSELNDIATGDIALQRGKTVLIEGLTHSYKTGMLLDLYIALCTLNAPEETSKKPTILLINGETSATSWLTRIYDTLKREETGGQVPTDTPSPADMVDYVNTRLQVGTGWTVSMLTMPTGKWSAQTFCDYLDEYAASGHDLQAVLLDGMESLSYAAIKDSNRLEDLKILRAHMASRRILFVATRRLPVASMEVRRSGVVGEDLLDRAFDMTRRTGGEYADAELMVALDRGNEKYDILIGYGSHRHKVKPTYKRLSFYDGLRAIKK